MKTLSITDYELDALREFEAIYGVVNYSLIAQLGDTCVIKVSENDYSTVIDAINYEY